ncbi:MAG: MBL fold metallo-hydrolase [Pseudomonadota bacterium]
MTPTTPTAPLTSPLTRRFFGRALAGGMALAPVAAATGALPAFAAEGPRRLRPFAQRRIGKFTVTFISDGFTDLPFGNFTGQTPEETAATAAALRADRSGALRLNFTQYLIDDGERLVMVDAGPAGGIGETGHLPENLETLGVNPDAVEALIVTHTHFDHVSGAIAGDRRVFRNAELYVDRRDVAHFTDPAKRSAAPDFLHSSFDTAAALMRLYPQAQQVEGAHQILPGLETVDLAGHTPGHIGVRVSDGGESLLIVGDMLFHPVLHPRSTTLGIAFEADPAAAQAMREAFFPAAAEEGALIAATHMPFPGLGRIVTDRGEFRWSPAPWAHE